MVRHFRIPRQTVANKLLGHGSLSIYLKNPGLFKSASAFAPIWYVHSCPFTSPGPFSHPTRIYSNPAAVPWGTNAFSNYLSSSSSWLDHDSSALLPEFAGELKILVDVGTEDQFLKQGQLQPQTLEKAGKKGVEVRMQDGYDHSYYFVSFVRKDTTALVGIGADWDGRFQLLVLSTLLSTPSTSRLKTGMNTSDTARSLTCLNYYKHKYELCFSTSTSLFTKQDLPLKNKTRECPKARASPRGLVDDSVKLEEVGIWVYDFA